MAKTKTCPNCHSLTIPKILYVMPMFDDKLDKAIKEVIIVLGGCCLSEMIQIIDAWIIILFFLRALTDWFSA